MAVARSVSPIVLPSAICAIAALVCCIPPPPHPPRRGAEERAHDASAEAVGDEHGEVPERHAHREPDQSGHQRFLPCFRRRLRPPDCSRTRRRAAALASLSSGRSASAPPLPLASPSPAPSPPSGPVPSPGAPTGAVGSGLACGGSGRL